MEENTTPFVRCAEEGPPEYLETAPRPVDTCVESCQQGHPCPTAAVVCVFALIAAGVGLVVAYVVGVSHAVAWSGALCAVSGCRPEGGEDGLRLALAFSHGGANGTEAVDVSPNLTRGVAEGLCALLEAEGLPCWARRGEAPRVARPEPESYGGLLAGGLVLLVSGLLTLVGCGVRYGRARRGAAAV